MLACLATLALHAATDGRYAGVASSSELTFEFVQAGAKSRGGFGRFETRLTTDALGQPAGLVVTVDTTSVATRDAERDALLGSEALFASERHPEARYVAESFDALDGTRYRARGTLTLRGVSRPLDLELRMEPAAKGVPGRLIGTAALSRLEFGVGQGEWASTQWVGDEIQLSFTVTLAWEA